MDRSREANKRASMAVTNGLARRRQRNSSLRDSPEDDGAADLQEPVRLRDRVSVKKDRDRDREHRERERERDRDRDRSGRNKRRRRERLMHHREGGGDESSEESVNDEEEAEEDDDAGGNTPLRIFPPNPVSSFSTLSNHPHRKSFIPPVKVYRSPPSWKTADEMIGVSVPRRARTASTKRSQECWNGGAGVVGEQFHRQSSTSPVRTNLIASVSSPAPISPPSSSNASARKKTKPNSSKQRPPKPSSSNQEEIEFEIAEVLYGLRQNQGPSRLDVGESVKFDSRETTKSCSDVKVGVSSPISNAHSSQHQIRPQASSHATPFSATAPKRKKPRPVRCEEESSETLNLSNCPIISSGKVEINEPPKIEVTSTKEDKAPGSAFENGSVNLSESKPSMDEVENKSLVLTTGDAPCSVNEPCSLKLGGNCLDSVTTTQANSTISVTENHLEEKFQIDLMAPPPQLKTSPERESEFDFISTNPKSASYVKTETKQNENDQKLGREEIPGEPGLAKVKTVVEEYKSAISRDINVDLRLDLEKHNDDSRHFHHVPKQMQQQQQSKPCRDDLNATDKTAQSNSSLSLPMSVVSWPSGVSPMGFMRPLQGVVSMDAGSTAIHSSSVQPPHQFFSQPRPKRCATHCYIARNICYYQQYARMNSFWPAAAAAASNTAASLYGKPCNLNLMAAAPELRVNIPSVKNVASLQDINSNKGPSLFMGQSGKEKASQVPSVADAVQRKQQILLPQTLSPGASTNIMHAPAFIFPLNQQQSVSAQPGSVKSSSIVSGSSASSSMNSTSSVAAAMSFSYPNMPTSETPYLAILQNNGYPFPIPAPVGGAPPSFFNSSFYSSQMLHPSQLQQQVVPPSSQQASHPNRTLSGGASSLSQKNLQTQQPRSGGGINLQGYSAPQKHHNHNHRHVQPLQHGIPSLHHQGAEMGCGEDSNNNNPSNRATSGNINVYGQNFAMPIHPVNFALMTSSVSSIDEKGQKHPHPQQQQQQQGLMKPGEASSQAFAMTFASINGGGGTTGGGSGSSAAPGFDIASMTQNHSILPDHSRHNYQVMAKSYQGKSESSRVEEERKAMAEKASNSQEDTRMGSSVLPSRAAAAVPSSLNNNSHLQQRHQQQQMLQVQKQQQQQLLPNVCSRGKPTSSNNGGIYPDSSIATKFPNVFPNLGNCSTSSNSSQSSPQWKNASLRTSCTTSPSQMPPSSSTKLVPQYNSFPLHHPHPPQQGLRPQQSHLQISFGANNPTKPPATLSQSPPRLMVGSPTTSSISKGSGGGSPRPAPTKPAHQASTLSSSSQSKNSPSMKSPSLGGVRNVLTSSVKMQVSQQQQPMSKQTLQQQTQLFFSSPYVQQAQMQALPDSSSAMNMNPPNPSSSSITNRFYNTSNNNQRRRSGPPSQQQTMMSHRSLPMSAPPPSISKTCDPSSSKASVAAVNVKLGGVQNSHQIVPAGFPYVQSMPSSQIKQVDQKQGAAAAALPSSLPPPPSS